MCENVRSRGSPSIDPPNLSPQPSRSLHLELWPGNARLPPSFPSSGFQLKSFSSITLLSLSLSPFNERPFIFQDFPSPGPASRRRGTGKGKWRGLCALSPLPVILIPLRGNGFVEFRIDSLRNWKIRDRIAVALLFFWNFLGGGEIVY